MTASANSNNTPLSPITPRVVVVLGMHRSGTSALTKALNVLGVSLSENLMAEGEHNPKGHWEDLDVVAINQKVLSHLNLDWFSPAKIELDLDDPYLQLLLQEAQQLVENRIAEYPLWGFKDPRTSYLLPFWLAVFNQAQVKAEFIYIHRNPLDVSRSLEKRDGFSHLHSYLLWGRHTVDNLPRLSGQSVMWLSFAQLLAQPYPTLEKLSQALQIDLSQCSGVDEFCNEFIDPGMSHSLATASDLYQDAACFPGLVDFHQLFVDLAESKIDLAAWLAQEQALSALEQFTLQMNLQMQGWVEERNQAYFYERDALKGQLYHANLRCEHLSQDAQHKQAQWQAELVQTTEHFRAEFDALHIQLSDTKSQLDSATRSLAQEKTQVKQLHTAITEREQHIQALQHAVDAIYHSTSWRITRPVRAVKNVQLRISQQVKRVRAVIRNKNGVINVAKQAYKIVRQDGVKALWRQTETSVQRLHGYEQWLALYGQPDAVQLTEMRAALDGFQATPTISILMPVYNPPIELLRAAIDSVLAQIYPHWQLCIANDASTDPQVAPVLAEYAAQDDRIQVVNRKENGHISLTSNSALELASGEYIALMDHDDLIVPDALYWVAEAINCDSNLALIYSDEDKITEDGATRYDPNFKPDWNPTLLLNHNYVSHLGVYKTDIARQIGGFRQGYEGAQDWDFLLRFSEQINVSQIKHIPRVLYHWRAIEGSTATHADEKPYALIAGIHSVEQHLERTGVKALVGKHPDRDLVRVTYTIPEPAPLVSIIIPTRNGLDVLEVCIDSILGKTTYPNYEIIIIDNGSDCPDTIEYLKQLNEGDCPIRVIRDDSPFNYSALNNRAAREARGELIALVNNDIEVITPEWLSELVGHAIQPQNGVVGARLWYPDDTLQHGGVILVGGVAGHAHKYFPKGHPGFSCRAIVAQNFSAVTAACFVVRKSIFDQVGGLNEQDLTIAFNDVDFCLRVQEAGYYNVWTPFAELYHYESKTRGFEDTPEKVERFNREVNYMKQRWGELLLNDPHYNANLTLDREDFSFAGRPRT